MSNIHKLGLSLHSKHMLSFPLFSSIRFTPSSSLPHKKSKNPVNNSSPLPRLTSNVPCSRPQPVGWDFAAQTVAPLPPHFGGKVKPPSLHSGGKVTHHHHYTLVVMSHHPYHILEVTLCSLERNSII